jgi:hypothetical protein
MYPTIAQFAEAAVLEGALSAKYLFVRWGARRVPLFANPQQFLPLAIWSVQLTDRSIFVPDFSAVAHVRRYSRQGSVLRALDPFILPAFSSGDFFLTLSHRFLKLSDLLA